MVNHVAPQRFILFMILGYIILSITSGQTLENGTFTDSRDGKTYKTVYIGGHLWMAENLNYAMETGSWTMKEDSAGKQFGRFYNWASAKKAIPVGWHLPSKQEYQNLLDSLGGSDEELFYLLVEGGKSGFNGLLTGSYQEVYGGKGGMGNFWSSTLWWFSSFGISENPWRLCIAKGNERHKPFAQIGHSAESDCGFNVRCIKND